MSFLSYTKCNTCEILILSLTRFTFSQFGSWGRRRCGPPRGTCSRGTGPPSSSSTTRIVNLQKIKMHVYVKIEEWQKCFKVSSTLPCMVSTGINRQITAFWLTCHFLLWCIYILESFTLKTYIWDDKYLNYLISNSDFFLASHLTSILKSCKNFHH